MFSVENAIHQLFLSVYLTSLKSTNDTPFLLSNANGPATSQKSLLTTDICLTPGCVISAAEILKNLDEDVDPCDNFYKFACGGYIDKQPTFNSADKYSELQDEINLKLKVLLEKELNGSESKTEKMLKDMYDSCIDLKSIEKSGSEPLQKELKSLGGWPVVMGDKWDESNFDWMKTLFAIRKHGYYHHILMTTVVSVNYVNNSRHVIILDQTELGMRDRSYYLKGLNDSDIKGYFDRMVKAATKLGANEITAKKELKEALNFEIDLANFSASREERGRSFLESYHKYTLPELQDYVQQINWTKYFNGLLNDPVQENESIIIFAPTFLKKFGEFIEKSDKRTIANYMMWRVVDQSTGLLSEEWRTLTNEERPERWKTCLSYVSGLFHIALNSQYVQNYFKNDVKQKALELAKYIREEFLMILNNVDWMDEKTKMEAKEKAKVMGVHIGYPDELLNDTLILEFYENLTITNGSFFENIMNTKKWKVDKAISKLRKPYIKGEWTKYSSVSEVNAAYDANDNLIEIPAGILQDIFFKEDRPNYLNFGMIGETIGHEITHGFDDQGRETDKDGNYKIWWDQKTKELFKEKVDCIIHQYGNYTTENGLNLNGFNTQGENIADNGGLKVAYLAYHTWVKDNAPELKLPGLKYTPNQLFWIGYANTYCVKNSPDTLEWKIQFDPQSPQEFRVLGSMSNLKEFAKDFQCPLGSPMNPQKKCQVW